MQPKVASTIKFQNFHLKQYTEAHCAHRDHKRANLVAVFRNTKTAITLGVLISRDLKLCQKVPTLDAHHPAKFQPPTPAVQKLSPKVFIFDSFQDPCSVDSFQDHLTPFKTIVLC